MKNGWRTVRGLIGVLGRVMLCGIFVAAAVGYTAPSVDHVAQAAGSGGLLSPKWVFAGSTLLLILGSLSVALGYRARIGALALLVFLGLTTYHWHGLNFWAVVSPQARQEQLLHLLTNLSMIGAMLFIVANGAGQMSLDGGRG